MAVAAKAKEVIGFATVAELPANKVAISQTAAGAKLEAIIIITIIITVIIIIIAIVIIMILLMIGP